MPLSPEAREKMAFSTPYGLYEFTVLPFSLFGAPVIFQLLMDKVLPSHGAYAAAYLDNTVIYSDRLPGQMQRVVAVLGALREAELTDNPKKSGIAIITGNVSQGFLGRTFPLTDLPRKGASDLIQWFEQCQEVFEKLKAALCGDTVLQMSRTEDWEQFCPSRGRLTVQRCTSVAKPTSYRSMVGHTVNSTQLAKDYTLLRSLLQSVRYYNRAQLYGPNAGRPRKNAIVLLEGFMKNAGSVVDAVMWQHYYMDGRVNKVEDFMKTRLLDTLAEQITKVLKVVNTHAPGKKVWLGGVGPAWIGGTNNLSDTYAAGFLWLNTLGMAAVHGVDVVMRHSFFDYGYTHLVDQNFNPLPDYWLSLVFKRLVGPRVLAVQVAGLQRKPRPGTVIRDKLRIYAHCTSFYNQNYVRGSITIYIINLHRSRKKIKLAGTLRNKTVHQYLMQPYGTDGLHSKSVQLNGEKLLMVDNETFPQLKPRTLRAGRTIAMPPMTIGFYVIKNINAYACRRYY
ncbi:inactive heparanase-2-like [Aplochiton taeniatus]